MVGQGIMSQDGQRYRCVSVANDCIRQFGGIDFAPAHGFAGRRPRKAAGIWSGIGDLDEKVLTKFIDTEDFLDLRFGLEHEIFWASATPKDHTAATAASFSCQDEG